MGVKLADIRVLWGGLEFFPSVFVLYIHHDFLIMGNIWNLGITQEVYREAVRSGGGIAFECKECLCRENFTAANVSSSILPFSC